MRRNPFAPEVPCHRIICADGVSVTSESVERANRNQSIGGFKGEPQDAPSGINQMEKRRLLKSEGVVFDDKGCLVDLTRWWEDFKL